MRHLIPTVPEAKEGPLFIPHQSPLDAGNFEKPVLEDPKTTLAALFAQVEQLQAETRSLKADNQALKAENRSLRQAISQLSAKLPQAALPLPVRNPVEFRRNRQGHYIRAHFWQLKEETPMVRICLTFLKWMALFGFGFMLAVLTAASCDQRGLVADLIQIAQYTWKPMVVFSLLAGAIASLTEAV
jgi:regulator of replication initiation timing